MSVMRRIAVLPVLALVLLPSGCKTFTSNPGTTLIVTNHSGAPIHNVEVVYPGGVAGAPSIAPSDSFRKWVPSKECKVQVNYLDTSNKEHPQKEINLGQTCPKTVIIEIAQDYSVTARGSQ